MNIYEAKKTLFDCVVRYMEDNPDSFSTQTEQPLEKFFYDNELMKLLQYLEESEAGVKKFDSPKKKVINFILCIKTGKKKVNQPIPSYIFFNPKIKIAREHIENIQNLLINKYAQLPDINVES